MKKYILVVIALFLLLSEAILSINPVAGFLLYVILITGCLIALSKTQTIDSRGKLVIAFLILPIVRIAELFIPFSFVYRTMIIYFILFFLVFFYSFRFKTDLGHTLRGLKMLPLTILLGIVIGVAGNHLFVIDKYKEFLFFLPIIAFAEEGLFRGLIQNLIWDNYGAKVSIVFTSLLYAIFSLGLDVGIGIWFAVFMFFTNLLICYIYNKQGNIWLTIPINLLMNLLLFVVPFS